MLKERQEAGGVELALAGGQADILQRAAHPAIAGQVVRVHWLFQPIDPESFGSAAELDRRGRIVAAVRIQHQVDIAADCGTNRLDALDVQAQRLPYLDLDRAVAGSGEIAASFAIWSGVSIKIEEA